MEMCGKNLDYVYFRQYSRRFSPERTAMILQIITFFIVKFKSFPFDFVQIRRFI